MYSTSRNRRFSTGSQVCFDLLSYEGAPRERIKGAPMYCTQRFRCEMLRIT